MFKNKACCSLNLLTFFILTLLVWGIHPFARGIRFCGDDFNSFYEAWSRLSQPLWKQLLFKYPPDTVTRTLAFWPFAVAMHTGAPPEFIQLFYGFAWILNGLAAAQLVRVLCPRDKCAAFLAACLTITATSDFHTDLIVFGPHLFGIALFFFGLAQLIRGSESDQFGWRLLSAFVLLLVSFFTVEYTYPGVPLIPFLLWIHTGTLRDRKFWRPVLVLTAAFLPAVSAVVWNILRPDSYANSVVLHQTPLSQWPSLVLSHLAHNFSPQTWAFRNVPPWYNNYVRVFFLPVFLILSSFGTLLVLSRSAVLDRGRAAYLGLGLKSCSMLAFVLLGAVLASSIASANLGGDYFVRSHFVSRVWASLALTVVLAGLCHHRLLKMLAAATVAFFVFFGIWGGLERQSYLLGYSLHEQRELLSLRAAVPNFRPPAHLLVIQPPMGPSLIACNNPNVLPLFYDRPGPRDFVTVAGNSAEQYSTVEGSTNRSIRILINSKTETFLNPSETIIAFYSISQGRFVKLNNVPAGLLRGSEDFFSLYQPDHWILPESEGQTTVRNKFLLPEVGLRPAPRLRSKERLDMVATSPSLKGALATDSLTPYIIEGQGPDSLVWLGSGRAQGYSELIYSPEPMSSVMRIRMSTGPSRRDAERHLMIRLSQADGGQRISERSFTNSASLNIPLELSAGNNIVEFWITDNPDNVQESGGDKRNLMALLQKIYLWVPPATRRAGNL